MIFPVRLELQLLEQLEKLVDQNQFQDVSKALRECTKIGTQVIEYKSMMNDKTKSKEFISKMQDMIKNEDFENFAHTLDSQQIEGFLYLLKIEKDKRYELKTLV